MIKPKVKYPLNSLKPLAISLCERLLPFCDRIMIAGSIRREKALVGDIELLVIPKMEVKDTSFSLFQEEVNLLEEEIQRLISVGEFYLRVKSDGTVADGDKIKLLAISSSHIPVDIFITTPEAWFNLLVCRTGGKLSNEQIAGMAKAKGWQWKMSGKGFYNERKNLWSVVTCEEDVFKFVGLPYLPPQERP